MATAEDMLAADTAGMPLASNAPMTAEQMLAADTANSPQSQQTVEPESTPTIVPQENGDTAMGALERGLNAPFAGVMDAFENTALGGSQAVAQGLNKIGLMSDQTYTPINEGIKDIKQMKDDAINEEYAGSPVSKALNVGGQLAGNMAQFSGLGGGKGYIPSIVSGLVTGAAQPTDSDTTNILGYNIPSRIFNAGTSGAAAGAGQAIGNTLSTQVTDPTKQAAMQTAQDFGIPVFRSQVSDGTIPKAVASFEKEIPFSGAKSAVSDQVGAFNEAVNNSIGQTGKAVTPENLDAANTQIGNVYKTMTGKYDLPVTPDFETKLLQLNDAAKTLGDQGKEYALQNQVDNVMSRIKNGKIDGSTYQGIRSRIGGLLRGQNGSPELGQLQDLLDGQFQGAMTPEDAEAFQTARGQYRNMLALEKPVAAAPNEPMSPARLQGAVKSVFGDYAYGGGSSLERLGRLGNLLKDSFPNSGTATRNQMYELAKHVAGPAIGVGVGAGEGYHEGGLGGAAAGALGGLALNRMLAQPFLYSRMGLAPSAIQSTAPSALASFANMMNNKPQ